MSETVTAIVVGLALGALVGFIGYRWGWQAGVGASVLVVLASLAVVLMDGATTSTVTLGLLAFGVVNASVTYIGERKQVA